MLTLQNYYEVVIVIELNDISYAEIEDDFLTATITKRSLFLYLSICGATYIIYIYFFLIY